MTAKKLLGLGILAAALTLTGCDARPSPRTAEEAAARVEGDIKYNLSIPDAATEVALVPGSTNWATFTLNIDGKRRRFLYYRSCGDTAVMGLTELNP